MIPISNPPINLHNENLIDKIALKLNSKSNDNAEAKKASQQFESIFVKQMLDKMGESLDKGGLFGDQPGSGFYQDVLFNEIARMIAEREELGLSKQLMKQIEGNKEEIAGIRNINDYDIIAKKINPVNIIKDLGRTLKARLEDLEPIINKASEIFGVDSKMIKAVIAQESYGNPRAVSPVGAKGLMQLMDSTAKGLGVKDSFDPEENIMGGTKYLKLMLDKFEDRDLALAAYNAGPGNVEKYGGVPPFKETKNYILKIKKYLNNLE